MNNFENPPTLAPEKPDDTPKKELPKNVVELETANGKYKIAYVSHIVETNPKVMEDCDAVILEGWNKYDKKEIAEGLDPQKASPQYKELVRSAIEQKKPIFLFDITEKYLKEEIVIGKGLLADPILKYLETATGAGLIYSGAKKMVKAENNLSRRDFLKSGAKILGGIYFAYPGVLDTILESGKEEPDETSLSRKFEKSERDIRYTIHPELNPKLMLGTRNCLAAQKSETISKILENELNKKPTLSLVIGANHHGVEDLLKDSPENRLKTLKKDLGKDFTSQKFIARIDFVDRSEIPLQEQKDKLRFPGDTVAKITIFPDPSF